MDSKINAMYEGIKEQGKAKGFKANRIGMRMDGIDKDRKDRTSSIANTVQEVVAREHGNNGNGKMGSWEDVMRRVWL